MAENGCEMCLFQKGRKGYVPAEFLLKKAALALHSCEAGVDFFCFSFRIQESV
jgi:hypothetical protein